MLRCVRKARKYKTWYTLAIVVITLIFCLAFAFVPVARSHGVKHGSGAQAILLTVLMLTLAATAAVSVFTTGWPLRSRVVELAAMFALTISGYAALYYSLSRRDPRAFSQSLSKSMPCTSP
jgi:NADH:ubiquinone oxidoreductase subunit H